MKKEPSYYFLSDFLEIFRQDFNHGLYGYARIILYKILKSGGKSKHKNVFPYRQSFARKKCKTQEFAGEQKRLAPTQVQALTIM